MTRDDTRPRLADREEWQFMGKQLMKKPEEAVDHPSHYMLGGVEVIDAIEAWKLGFHLGNAVKYIARAGKKDPAKTVEDLRKAEFYLKRKIQILEAEGKR